MTCRSKHGIYIQIIGVKNGGEKVSIKNVEFKEALKFHSFFTFKDFFRINRRKYWYFDFKILDFRFLPDLHISQCTAPDLTVSGICLSVYDKIFWQV